MPKKVFRDGKQVLYSEIHKIFQKFLYSDSDLYQLFDQHTSAINYKRYLQFAKMDGFTICRNELVIFPPQVNIRNASQWRSYISSYSISYERMVIRENWCSPKKHLRKVFKPGNHGCNRHLLEKLNFLKGEFQQEDRIASDFSARGKR